VHVKHQPNLNKIPNHLFIACEKGDLNIVQRVLAAGADTRVMFVTSTGHNSYLRSAVKNKYLDIVKQLIIYDTNHEMCTSYENLLICSIESQNMEMISTLLNGECRNAEGKTPLLIICEPTKINTIIVKTLLFVGANVNCTTEAGVTPLMLATQFKNLEIIQILMALERIKK
jgi:ankyrin repeat protein